MDTSRFDNIRPYTDAEIPATMERIARSEMFPLIASYVFPDEDTESVRRRVLSIKSIADFQRMVMVPVNERIIERSISHFSYSGLEQLSRDKSYLFVSNHRDIMLDASLLQHILHLNGYETSEITFGANLMSLPLLIDIGRANKMFRVERGGSFKDFYRSSLLLSDYIRHTITERHSSVWIAQRNGRTKDGIDRTEPGLISMLAGSMPSDKIEALDSLRIVPVAVSYEWETCDVAKALELYESRFTRYVKKPGEDLNSIISGIVARKGAVSIDICEPLRREEMAQYESLTRAEYVKEVAVLIDSRINSAYRLFPNNYIAHDMRYGTKKYSDRYTPEQKERFREHLRSLEVYQESELETIADIFLGIYANPVNSKITAK